MPELTTTANDNEPVFSQELSLCQIIWYRVTLCNADSRMLTLDMVKSSNAAKDSNKTKDGTAEEGKVVSGKMDTSEEDSILVTRQGPATDAQTSPNTLIRNLTHRRLHTRNRSATRNLASETCTANSNKYEDLINIDD